MNPPVIQFRAASKRFGELLAVDALDLDVAGGRCVGLLGPNGAGKTTALGMVYGAVAPTSGSVRVFGLDARSERREIRRRIGVALQDNVLIEALTPIENLRVFGRYHLLDRDELERRIAHVIEFMELDSHRDVPAHNLSGGYQRRLAIGLALLANPKLLILDEPTTGLDPAVRRVLWDRIRTLGETGTTVLITTHYMEEAERLADEVVILAKGRIVDAGAPAEMISRSLAPRAIELRCDRDAQAALLRSFDGKVVSWRMRDGLTAYVGDEGAFLEHATKHPRVDHARTVVRPTNLEDVFLTLTGHTLDDGA